ncbi:MAG: GH92 family glycosyl hydrolase [Chitinophagaceae bacterium]
MGILHMLKMGRQAPVWASCKTLLYILLLTSPATAQSLISYVQPLAGTAGATTMAAQKHSEAGSEKNANTIPAVGLPFGMTQWTPQTSLTENKCIPPYFYKDKLLRGFRGSHWLSGSCTQDYGSVTLMPITGKLRTTADTYSASFSHSDETATPAYYKLELPAQHITTEMTATLRCGLMRFTTQQDDSLYVLVMPNSDQGEGFVALDAAKGEVWGYNPVHRIYQGWGNKAGFNGWFFMKFQKRVLQSGTYSGATMFDNSSISSQKDIGAFLGFVMKKGEQLVVKIGTSFSSLEGAKKNLQTEIGGKGFNELLRDANAIWQKALGQVMVETANEKDKRIFYTAMYHAMQHPRLFNDVDGMYPPFAGGTGLVQMKNGSYYDDFSMWDIYRAQLPLFEILQPGKINSFVQSMIAKAEQGGWLPIFPCWNSYTSAMIGDHATAFIASAYNKGIRNYDVQKAYAVMRKNAFEVAEPADYLNGMGRRALPSYLQYGFIPTEDSVPIAFHKKEQVSRTLEYAFDDYALSMVANSLGKNDDYKKLRQRSFNYENVYDKNVGMVRGKNTNGQWFSPFNPDAREPYITEGTPRQYSFYVPQDVPGLAKLMGGEQKLEQALDSLFLKDEYWHGNEPGHQIPFMYNYTAAPYKTQQQVRKILAEEYSDGPGGLSGNDDAGQMSAWYVFAAMGFYPVNPVSGEYILASPLFDKIRIQLPGNKILEIVCHKPGSTAVYIGSVIWNGRRQAQNFIRHTDIMKGGKLEIALQEKPSRWGTALNSRPPALTR